MNNPDFRQLNEAPAAESWNRLHTYEKPGERWHV
jgi:hypothetical protein